jgi:hypothetical protein
VDTTIGAVGARCGLDDVGGGGLTGAFRRGGSWQRGVGYGCMAAWPSEWAEGTTREIEEWEQRGGGADRPRDA